MNNVNFIGEVWLVENATTVLAMLSIECIAVDKCLITSITFSLLILFGVSFLY